MHRQTKGEFFHSHFCVATVACPDEFVRAHYILPVVVEKLEK